MFKINVPFLISPFTFWLALVFPICGSNFLLGYVPANQIIRTESSTY